MPSSSRPDSPRAAPTQQPEPPRAIRPLVRFPSVPGSDAFRPSPLLTLQLFPNEKPACQSFDCWARFCPPDLLSAVVLCACRARSAASERIQPRSDAMIARPRRRHGYTARGRGCRPCGGCLCGGASEVDAGWISHGLGSQNGRIRVTESRNRVRTGHTRRFSSPQHV